MEMKNNRREFLTRLGWLGAAAAGAAVLGLDTSYALAAEEKAANGKATGSPAAFEKGAPSVLDNFSRAHFAQHLNSSFRVAFTGKDGIPGATELKLVEATDNKGNDPKRGFESFSLIFTGASSVPLDQSTYAFAHPKMGNFDLFMVPLSDKDGVRRYQVIFNRLHQV